MNQSSCIMILFGALGDLAKRLLFPALYNLEQEGCLAQNFKVVGVARKDLDVDSYRNEIKESLHSYFERSERVLEGLKDKSQDRFANEEIVSRFLKRFQYFRGDLNAQETYGELKASIERIDHESNTGGRFLFYLATPPALFETASTFLASVGLLTETQDVWRRVVFEKPFGTDFESARSLNSDLSKLMKESQIYRIDHYLGKETVQNIMALRFSNEMFESLWNYRYLKSVQINVPETLGVEARGSYYDGVGAVRDMVSNHLLQLVALIGMEPPNSFDANDIRDEKVKLLRAIKPFSKRDIFQNVIRGQYGPGKIDGKDVCGYRSEPNVNPHSMTETFVAMKLEVENWRWSGVPFYLRTGKRMAKRVTEIIVEFKNAPFHMFRGTDCSEIAPNYLTIQIQPEEKICLSIGVKVPGPSVCLGTVPMEFSYRKHFGTAPKTGYETLLLDAMKGDATLFQRADQIECAWRIVDPILKTWAETDSEDFPNYPAGSWGPAAAIDLLDRDQEVWPEQKEAA